MKRTWIILAVIAAVVLLWWHFGPRRQDDLSRGGKGGIQVRAPFRAGPQGASPSPVIATSPDGLSTGSPLAAELNAPGGDALHDVQALHALIRQYLRILHHRQGPPIGDDIDLAHVLTGHNPMRFVFVPPGNPALSADGHLRDRWGTPYFIHPIGYGTFEVRSAGPDRKMFTKDDIIDGLSRDTHTEIPDETPEQ